MQEHLENITSVPPQDTSYIYTSYLSIPQYEVYTLQTEKDLRFGLNHSLTLFQYIKCKATGSETAQIY